MHNASGHITEGHSHHANSENSDQDSSAVKLRQMLVKEREHPVSDLEQFLGTFSRKEARAIINTANRNGKTPFHHACQFRSSPDAVELLLRHDADINKTTRRGHTALIYACGRGRAETVATLLAAGANIKVRAVTGDDAITMAEGRVDDETLQRLQRAYTNATGPLIDFTASPEAQAAQVEHVSGCKHCRDKHAKAATDEVPPTENEVVLRARLRDNLSAALTVDPGLVGAQQQQQDAVTAALIEMAIALDCEDMASATANTPHAAHPSLVHAMPDRFRSLKIEIGAFFRTHGGLAGLTLALP